MGAAGPEDGGRVRQQDARAANDQTSDFTAREAFPSGTLVLSSCFRRQPAVHYRPRVNRRTGRALRAGLQQQGIEEIA